LNAWFVDYGSLWFARGGISDNGLGAGVHAFLLSTGRATFRISFRVV